MVRSEHSFLEPKCDADKKKTQDKHIRLEEPRGLKIKTRTNSVQHDQIIFFKFVYKNFFF